MDEIIFLNTSETEHIIRIYLKELVENGAAVNIINHQKWKDMKDHYISDFQIYPSTNIIEFQRGRWITLHINDETNNDQDNFRTAYVIDPVGKDICTEIRQLLVRCEIRLKKFQWLSNSDILTSWIYSLYAAREIVSSFSTFVSKTNISEIRENIKPFLIDVSETKRQFQKVKDKIKVCSNLFSISCNRNIPKVITYKYAILILQFVESFALQDIDISNNTLKDHIIEIIGCVNNLDFSVIRDWLLHRNKRYVIYPKQLKAYIFKEDDSNIAFGELRDYINIIFNIIQGHENTKIPNLPTDIIKLSKKICNKFSKTYTRYILRNYSYSFIKQGFSIHKINNVDKTFFDFIVNFMPLLKYFYGSQTTPYKEFTDLRNELVHNVYILYQTNKDLPYISFQSKLRELKEKFLIFNLCNRLSAVINKFKDPKDSRKQLEKCFKTFTHDFKDELFPKRMKFIIKNNKELELNNLIEIIEQYLKTLPLINKSNKIAITDIEIRVYDLPTDYLRFTDVQRKLIFDYFKHLAVITNSGISTEERNDLISNIKANLISIGVTNCNFNLINDSINNSKRIPNDEFVKSILNHISTLINMQKDSSLDFEAVLQDYFKLLKEKDFSSKKYSKKCLDSSKMANKLYEIKVTKDIIYMDLFTIVKNIVPVYLEARSVSILFRNLTHIFNDENVLEMLANECFEMENLKEHIMSLPLLVPLGTKLLCEGKLKFKKIYKIKDENKSDDKINVKDTHKDKECSFIRYCIKILLMSQFQNKYFENLLCCKTKNNVDIFQEILDILSNMNLTFKIKKKVEYLLSFREFQTKIMKNFKSNNPKNSPFYKILVLSLLKYKYESSKTCYLHKNFKDALCHVERKRVGLSAVLKELLEKKIIDNSYRVTQMKFLIAQIKIKIGTENLSHEKAPKMEIEESDLQFHDKHFTEAKWILKKLLISLSNFDNSKKKLQWELHLRSYIGYTYNLLGNYSKSLTNYDQIFQDLYNLRSSVFVNDLNKHPITLYKALMKSPEYLSAIKLNPIELNILKISNKINDQRYYLGNSSINKKNKTKFFIEALKGYQNAHELQREILGVHNRISVSSLLKIGMITTRLNFRRNADLYRKSAALFVISINNKHLKEKEIKCINRFRKKLERKVLILEERNQ